jgi:beta-galactosidase
MSEPFDLKNRGSIVTGEMGALAGSAAAFLDSAVARVAYLRRRSEAVKFGSLMHWEIVAIVLAAAAIAAAGAHDAAPAPAADWPRTIESFDSCWRFIQADPAGAAAAEFNDSSWRLLNVPHDWSIEGPVAESNPAGGAGAFLPAGVGWYRKHFTLPEDQANRLAFIEFDGVMANSDVWINGSHLGKRPYGYVSFYYPLNGHLNFGPGQSNVLAVRADNGLQPASRWYAGAGIYRHTRLIFTDPVHLDEWGVFVTTPHVADDQATVHVKSTVLNDSTAAADITVEVTLIAPAGQSAGTVASSPMSVACGKRLEVNQELTIKPRLWDLDHPNLYQAVVRVREGGRAVDDQIVHFGVRTAQFKADTGFWLNGQNIKLKGVCLHGDMDGLGAAVPLGAWAHRLAALKRLGCNAIRTSHNPVAPEFLDLCDRMGFLVMDEMFDCWTVAKNPFDYHLYFKQWSSIDAADTVRRDRNHPCVILYSAGNEIHDTRNPQVAIPILKSLLAVFHQNDPTRPVTQALFRPNVSYDFDDGLADLLDVIGVNYREAEALAAHSEKPTRKITGTENGKDLKMWAFVRDNPPNAGQFLWSGADYLGEARRWPAISRETGLLDLTDQPYPESAQQQSWWSKAPMVAIVRDAGAVATGNLAGEPQMRPNQFADWSPTGRDAGEQMVLVYSNAQSVELILNGTSLGSQRCSTQGFPCQWKVRFVPGTLQAIARDDGKVVATDELHTAAAPAKIVLGTDRSSLTPVWDDVAFVTVKVTDAAGVTVPMADNLITFTVDGPGKVIAVENGDVRSHEPFQAMQRHAYHGCCTVILRATSDTGTIRLRAAAEGLAAGSIELRAAAPPAATAAAHEDEGTPGGS